MTKCLESSSKLVQIVSRNAVFNGRVNSILGRNVLSCCLCYGISFCDLSLLSASMIKQFIERDRPDDVRARTLLLLELLFAKEGCFILPGFCYDEIDAMIKDVCIN